MWKHTTGLCCKMFAWLSSEVFVFKCILHSAADTLICGALHAFICTDDTSAFYQGLVFWVGKQSQQL